MGNTSSTPRLTHALNSLVGSPNSVRVWRPSASIPTGALLFPDGSCYYGSISSDEPIRSGFGIYLTASGTLYEGTFIKDTLEGECVVTTAEGECLLATFSKGELTGQGDPVSKNPQSPSIKTTDTPTPLSDSAPTPTSVHQWLVNLNMEKYEDRFRDTDAKLPNIRDKLLQAESMPYGHRARLISNLGRLNSSYQSTGGYQLRGTPPVYLSVSSSSVYVPRAPSRPDKWLIPSNQLRLDSRISVNDSCQNCSQVFRGSWLGKDVVIRQYLDIDMDSRVMELLSRMAKIRHPNICLFMAASYSESRTLSIVTEYVYHGSIDKFRTNRTAPRKPQSLSTQNILHLSRGIAVGCAYLRKQGFSHKNLKPSNILIDASLDVKLTDYFVMEFNDLLHRSPPCTRTVVPKYVAPESLRRIPFVPYGIDSASDVYSFGIILWELVTGRKPYENLSQNQIRILVGFAGYREPRARISTLRGISRLIEKCTRQDPSDRPNFERLVVALSTMHKSANSAAEDALITFISGR